MVVGAVILFGRLMMMMMIRIQINQQATQHMRGAQSSDEQGKGSKRYAQMRRPWRDGDDATTPSLLLPSQFRHHCRLSPATRSTTWPDCTLFWLGGASMHGQHGACSNRYYFIHVFLSDALSKPKFKQHDAQAKMAVGVLVFVHPSKLMFRSVAGGGFYYY